jgi:cystathionine beta-lyase
MSWDFDEIISREGTGCVKYDRRKEVFGTENVIPMWVADMDFKSPDFIIRALQKRLDHNIMGYSIRPPEYSHSIKKWLGKRHNWPIKEDWICFSPGIVPALNLCTLAFTKPGDSIIIQPPVYTPFFSAVTRHGRKLIFNQLEEKNGKWIMNLDRLSDSITGRTRMIILSNPHNPVGRAWSKEELLGLCEICLKKNVIIVSDEIHCDLVLPGFMHTPVATLSEETAAITVTCIAPSKTFNLAGLSTSSVIIPDHNLRKEFNATIDRLHIGNGNIFGTVASISAYSEGESWLEELLLYLERNVNFVIDYLTVNIPEIVPVRPEATYMMWLDCRRLGLSGKELNDFFVFSAGVGMNEGSTFGPGGEGFMRMNLATQRITIGKALEKIEKAVKELR